MNSDDVDALEGSEGEREVSVSFAQVQHERSIVSLGRHVNFEETGHLLLDGRGACAGGSESQHGRLVRRRARRRALTNVRHVAVGRRVEGEGERVEGGSARDDPLLDQGLDEGGLVAEERAGGQRSALARCPRREQVRAY